MSASVSPPLTDTGGQFGDEEVLTMTVASAAVVQSRRTDSALSASRSTGITRREVGSSGPGAQA